MKLVTIASVSERLKISGSLARGAFRELVSKGALRVVSASSKMPVLTRASTVE